MIKRISILICTILLFCSCTKDNIVTVVEENPTTEKKVSLVFALDKNLDDAFLLAAQNFAYEVALNTNNQVEIEVAIVKNVESDIILKKAQLGFFNPKEISNNFNSFNLLNKNFLYLDYLNFTMICNSPQILQAIAQETTSKTKFLPLAAYYSPSNHLLTSWQLSDINNFSDTIIAVNANDETFEGLQRLGGTVLIEPSSDTRISMLIKNEIQGAELTLDQISEINWIDSNFYLTLTYHTLSPTWLVADKEFYNKLTTKQIAVVKDSLAKMHGNIDQVYLDSENLQIETLKKQGLLVSNNFELARSEIELVAEDEQIKTEDALKIFIKQFISEIQK